MTLERSFEIKAPIDSVWTALLDLERVAPCLPGAAIERRADDGSCHGTFQVELGPTTSADEQTRAATLDAERTDKRGQAGAQATTSTA
jgi:carbon monoxide dehydrogenase subunit G